MSAFIDWIVTKKRQLFCLDQVFTIENSIAQYLENIMNRFIPSLYSMPELDLTENKEILICLLLAC